MEDKKTFYIVLPGFLLLSCFLMFHFPSLISDLHHERSYAGKACIRRHEKLFSLELDNGVCESPVAEHDQITVGSFTVIVKNVTKCCEGVFFLDIHEAPP